MPNYVQLGQGLRDIGQSMSAGYDFINKQRALDIDQQQADAYTDKVKLDRQKYDDDIRRENNQIGGRKILSVFDEAAGSGETNFTDFLSKNKTARDTLVDGFVTSNSRARGAAAGKKVVAIPGQDGKFDFLTVDSNGTTSPLMIDGQSVRYTGDEIYRMAATELAGVGLADMADTLHALDANKHTMPPAEYQQQRSELIQRIDDTQTQLEQHGIDSQQVMDNYHSAGARHSEVNRQLGLNPTPVSTSAPSAPPSYIAAPTASTKASSPVSLGDSTVGRFFPASIGAAPPATPADAVASSSSTPAIDSQGNISAEARARHPVAARFADITGIDLSPAHDVPRDAPISAQLGAAVREAGMGFKNGLNFIATPLRAVAPEVKNFVSALSGDYSKDQPKAAPSPASSAAPKTSTPSNVDTHVPQTPDEVIQRAQEQVTQNPPRNPVQQEAIVKRAIRQISPSDGLQRDPDGRRSAYHYATASVIMGFKPDPVVMGNLMAGDTPNGRHFAEWKENNENARHAANQELEWYKASIDEAKVRAMREGTAVQRAQVEKAEAANIIALQEHSDKRRAAAIDEAARAVVNPILGKGGKEATDALIGQMKGRIGQVITLEAGQLADLGWNQNNFYRSLMLTAPAFIHQVARFIQDDDAAAKHNKSFKSWFMGDNPRHSIGDGLLKFQQVHNPVGFQQTVNELKVAIGSDVYGEWQKANPGKSPSAQEIQTLTTRTEQQLATKLNSLKDIKLGDKVGVAE